MAVCKAHFFAIKLRFYQPPIPLPAKLEYFSHPAGQQVAAIGAATKRANEFCK